MHNTSSYDTLYLLTPTLPLLGVVWYLMYISFWKKSNSQWWCKIIYLVKLLKLEIRLIFAMIKRVQLFWSCHEIWNRLPSDDDACKKYEFDGWNGEKMAFLAVLALKKGILLHTNALWKFDEESSPCSVVIDNFFAIYLDCTWNFGASKTFQKLLSQFWKINPYFNIRVLCTKTIKKGRFWHCEIHKRIYVT